jgi:zinc transporter ZupT
MIHNVTEGLGIAAPAAEERRLAVVRAARALRLIAGGPAILGAWTGGFVANDVLAILFFGAGRGWRPFEVVAEVVRYVMRRDPGGSAPGFAVGGFLAGIVIMYVTGLIAG